MKKLLLALSIFFISNCYTQTSSKYRIAAHSNPVYFGTDSFPTVVVSFSFKYNRDTRTIYLIHSNCV
jgi:hypothetical protein